MPKILLSSSHPPKTKPLFQSLFTTHSLSHYIIHSFFQSFIASRFRNFKSAIQSRNTIHKWAFLFSSRFIYSYIWNTTMMLLWTYDEHSLHLACIYSTALGLLIINEVKWKWIWIWIDKWKHNAKSNRVQFTFALVLSLGITFGQRTTVFRFVLIIIIVCLFFSFSLFF